MFTMSSMNCYRLIFNIGLYFYRFSMDDGLLSNRVIFGCWPLTKEVCSYQGNTVATSTQVKSFKVTFAPNLAKKISTNFCYLSLLFQLSVAYYENFKEIKAWEVLKFWKEKIGILPIYFAWRQKLIVFTLCQFVLCTKILQLKDIRSAALSHLYGIF